MTPANAARFERFANSASDSLAAGFATMSAKKEANGNVSRAYEIIKDALFNALLANGGRGEHGDDAMDLPYELRHVKVEKFLAIAAKVGYDCEEKLKALIALRAEIAAEEVVKPVKVVKTVADASKGERIQMRGNCQVCGRDHAVVDGFVAKHGYKVKHGFFNGICDGQNYAPVQIKKDQAEATIELCNVKMAEYAELKDALMSGKKNPASYVTGYGSRQVVKPYAECDEWEKRAARRDLIARAESEIYAFKNHAAMLVRLIAEYHGKELRPVVV